LRSPSELVGELGPVVTGLPMTSNTSAPDTFNGVKTLFFRPRSIGIIETDIPLFSDAEIDGLVT